MSAQMTNSMSDIASTLSAADVSMNAQVTKTMVTIVSTLAAADVSMNTRTNTTLDKLDIIMQTLASNNAESENNWSEIINNLNMKSNETQQTMIEYIGRYIVIPLYKQRLNDIYALSPLFGQTGY